MSWMNKLIIWKFVWKITLSIYKDWFFSRLVKYFSNSVDVGADHLSPHKNCPLFNVSTSISFFTASLMNGWTCDSWETLHPSIVLICYAYKLPSWGVGTLQQWKQGNTCLQVLKKAAYYRRLFCQYPFILNRNLRCIFSQVFWLLKWPFNRINPQLILVFCMECFGFGT